MKTKKVSQKKVSKTKPIVFGALKGQLRMSKDAFAPMELVISKNGAAKFR